MCPNRIRPPVACPLPPPASSRHWVYLVIFKHITICLRCCCSVFCSTILHAPSFSLTSRTSDPLVRAASPRGDSIYSIGSSTEALSHFPHHLQLHTIVTSYVDEFVAWMPCFLGVDVVLCCLSGWHSKTPLISPTAQSHIVPVSRRFYQGIRPQQRTKLPQGLQLKDWLRTSTQEAVHSHRCCTDSIGRYAVPSITYGMPMWHGVVSEW